LCWGGKKRAKNSRASHVRLVELPIVRI
jgi:hypothetical protein